MTLYHASEGVSPFHRGSGMATLSAVLLEPLPALLTTEAPTATAPVTAKRKPPKAELAQPADAPGQSPRPDQGALKDRLLYLGLWAALFVAGLLVAAGVGVKQTYSTLSDYLVGKTPPASTTHTSYVSLYTSFTSLGDQSYRSWAVALAIVLPAVSIAVGLIMTLNSAETSVALVMTLLSLRSVVFAAIWVWIPVLMDHKDTFISASTGPIADGTLPSVTPGLGLILSTVPLVALGATFSMLAKLAK